MTTYSVNTAPVSVVRPLKREKFLATGTKAFCHGSYFRTRKLDQNCAESNLQVSEFLLIALKGVTRKPGLQESIFQMLDLLYCN